MRKVPAPPHRYVAVEGVDGAGKSSLVRSFATALRRRGWSVGVRREPYDATLGRLAQTTSVRDPWAGGIYFTLDRHLARASLDADLRRFDVVVTDRSYFSTLAYQGSALPAAQARRLAALQRTATRAPDRVALLAIEPAVALRRLGKRSRVRAPLERLSTLRRVAREYRRLATPPRWVVLDATRSRPALVRELLTRMGFARATARRRRPSLGTRRRT